MKQEDIRNLLGGYAAGTLSPAEREALFEAAMEDQELFDALAEEQALKEILDDPESRRYLRESLGTVEAQPEPRSWWRLSWWPAAAGMAAVTATLAIVTVVGIQKTTSPPGSTRKEEAVTATATAPAANAPQQQPAAPTEMAGVTRSAAPPVVGAKKTAAAGPRALEEAKSKDSAAASDEKRAVPAVTVAPENKPDQQPPSKPVVTATSTVPVPVPAAAAPPPSPAPADTRKQEVAAAAPTASQLYLAQFRQMQMQQESLQSQQTRSSFAAGELSRRQSSGVAPAAPASPAAAGGGARRDQLHMQRAEPGKEVARESAMDKVAAVEGPVQNAGIRYEILRRNSQGQLVQTRLDTRFEEGDEIVWRVEKNSGGIVTVMQRNGGGAWNSVSLPTQTLFEARTEPVRLQRGTVEFVVILTPNTLRPAQRAATAAAMAGAAGSTPTDQITEASGNAVYVVAPGIPRSPVTARITIVVN